MTTSFVYNGLQLWAQYDGSGAVQARYLYGQGIDEVLARWQPGSGTAWYLTDRLATVRDILNAAGQIIDHIDYNAWGFVLSETNPSAGDGFGFTGQWYDAVTGLYDYLNRWYDPQLQRFLSQDPLGWLSGQSNPYAYVGNSPLNFVDPTGLEVVGEAFLEREGVAIASAEVGAVLGYTCGYLDAWTSGATAEQAMESAIEGAYWGWIIGGSVAYYGWNSPRFMLWANIVGLGFAAYSLETAGNDAQLLVRSGCIVTSFVAGYGISRNFPRAGRGPKAPKTPAEIEAEGYGLAAEKGPNPLPPASERTPLPVAPEKAPPRSVPPVSEEFPELGYRNPRNATRAEREAILEEMGFRERGPRPGEAANSTEIGDMFRDELATRISQNKNVAQVRTGGDVEPFPTPWGDRIFDIEVTLKDGRTIYLETKAGGAGVDPLQQVKDNWLRETGVVSTVVRQNR